jgi:hypothetical protein
MTTVKLQVGEDGTPSLLVNGKPAPINGSSYQLSAVSLAESLADAMKQGVLLEKQAAAARPGPQLARRPQPLASGIARLESLADRLARLERQPR